MSNAGPCTGDGIQTGETVHGTGGSCEDKQDLPKARVGALALELCVIGATALARDGASAPGGDLVAVPPMHEVVPLLPDLILLLKPPRHEVAPLLLHVGVSHKLP